MLWLIHHDTQRIGAFEGYSHSNSRTYIVRTCAGLEEWPAEDCHPID